jgi:hypothetical protein
MKYTDTLCPQVIYVFRINDEEHKGCLKVGMTKLTGEYPDFSKLESNSNILNNVARARIEQYTSTAAIPYDLLHTELSLFFNGSHIVAFDDHQVHEVLRRSGIKQKKFEYADKAKEWFITDLQTVKNAILAAKQGRNSLLAEEKSSGKDPIIFRPEQEKAIKASVNKFKEPGTRMLWNCKMRFGKTLSALQVVREMKFKRSVIVTHRPVVDAGWFEDFDKIFWDLPEYRYGSKNNGEDLVTLIGSDKPMVYFASMQDLRGSAEVGGQFDKNDLIYKTHWDLVIVDEAHEGTQTELGQKVLKALVKKKTCVLNLSGTPFNIVSDYNEDEIVNWTYVDEQKAKEQWDKEHPLEHNPYGGLPRMNMAIYDLGKVFDKPEYEAKYGNMQFNFREFFRTDPTGNQFVHEKDVNAFLDLLCKPDPETNYPFSTKAYCEIFRHTFWVVPGVKEARALSSLLKKHPVFGYYQIINVAGDGDDDSEYCEALDAVKTAIGDHPEDTYTITISCGRLTTGVSVKAWTAVFMLKGDAKTKAQGYMQTIFRVQTPATIGGKRKEECYVFDFAPDRILTALDESIRANSYAKANKPGTQKAVLTDEEKAQIDEFMHFCPVVAWDGSQMLPYNVALMMEHLKRVQIERVVRNGFEDDSLYNNDFLMNLDDEAIKQLEDVKGIIGTSKAQKKMGDLVINDQGLTGEEEKASDDIKPKKPELTEEQKKAKAELDRRRKQKQAAISILRGLSIRFPMLIYGAELKDENVGITLDNFTSFIDKESWEEFMPQGISMQRFYALRKYYDPDVFNACGKRIREKARLADNLPPLERTQRIADIFATFRNPDKETVLTPWRVVNMHLSDTIGGYDFYDEQHIRPIEEPRLVEHGKITWRIFEGPDPQILEINSKSGLYPLYMAYSLFRVRLEQWANAGLIANPAKPTFEEQQTIWDDVVHRNLFILCKTPMARSITKRTLVGFRDVKVNAKYEPNLIETLSDSEQREALITKLHQGKTYWKAIKDNMIQFEAIVGNPPYQEIGGSGGTNDAPIFQHFCNLATNIKPYYISLIIPSKWFTGGRESLLGDFRKRMLNSSKIERMIAYSNSRQLFSNVEIKGGVCYYLENTNYHGKCEYTFITDSEIQSTIVDLSSFDLFVRNPKLEPIVAKVFKQMREDKTESVETMISADTPFGIPTNPSGSKKNPFSLSPNLTDEYNTPVLYLKDHDRVYGFIRNSDIRKNRQDIDANKVYVPKAGGSGNDNLILGKPVHALPNSVCSQTFLYAKLDSEKECANFVEYLKTRFVRALISSIKITQDAASGVYHYVPKLDFHESWTDEKLYAKYGITPEEQAYIESLIKPME